MDNKELGIKPLSNSPHLITFEKDPDKLLYRGVEFIGGETLKRIKDRAAKYGMICLDVASHTEIELRGMDDYTNPQGTEPNTEPAQP